MDGNHISTEEAREQGLPGSDVFRFSHLLYRDPFYRDAGIVHLNYESYKAFSDTIILGQRHELTAEDKAVEEWLKAGDIASGIPYPSSPVTFEHMNYRNYENFKIACGFELHLKGRLLSKDFIIHQIDEKKSEYEFLAKEQKKRPIQKSELFAIEPYCFDGQQNYLPGLASNSLNYEKLTCKPKYKKALGLPDEHLCIMDDYRKLRNQIHLPGDVVEVKNIQCYSGSIDEFIINFINAEIVAYTNELIERHQLNYPLLEEFS